MPRLVLGPGREFEAVTSSGPAWTGSVQIMQCPETRSVHYWPDCPISRHGWSH